MLAVKFGKKDVVKSKPVESKDVEGLRKLLGSNVRGYIKADKTGIFVIFGSTPESKTSAADALLILQGKHSSKLFGRQIYIKLLGLDGKEVRVQTLF